MTFEDSHKILIVDDAKDMQLLLEFDLTSAGYQVICCDGGEEALFVLTEQKIDLILLDMYMPGLSGLETLKKLKSGNETKTLPVIMLSASNDEDEIVNALELGAEDYVIKPYTAKILFARIRTAIRLKEKTQQLEYLAQTDFLTNINNRGNFFDLSSNALNLANRSGQPVVVAMFDIDFFKQVNDVHGHDAGDKVLITFAEKLTKAFRDYDIVGRIGGEEFAVCLPNTCLEKAQIVCDRLRQQIEKTNFYIDDINEQYINITVSIGVSLAHGDSISIDDLLKEADKALYYAKAHGRNQVVNVKDILDEKTTDSVSLDKIPDMTEQVVELEQEELSPIIIERADNEVTMKDSLDGIDYLIGVNNVLGDEDLFHEILVMFYQDHHLDGDKLKLALQEQDIPSAKHLSHTLKGVASSVGATRLFEKAKAFDLAINEQKEDEYEQLFAGVFTELTQVMQSIEANLDVSDN